MGAGLNTRCLKKDDIRSLFRSVDVLVIAYVKRGNAAFETCISRSAEIVALRDTFAGASVIFQGFFGVSSSFGVTDGFGLNSTNTIRR